MDQLAQAIANQQQTGGQINTGNPQQVPTNSNLQPNASLNTSLQNAGNSSVNAINMLDQGSKALTVSGVDRSVPLAFANTTSTTTTNPSTTQAKTDVTLIATLGIVAALCFAVLAYGLLKPKKYKPAK